MKRVFITQEAFANLQQIPAGERQEFYTPLEKFIFSEGAQDAGLTPVKAGDARVFTLNLAKDYQALVRQFEDATSGEGSCTIITAFGKKKPIQDLAGSIRFGWDGETVNVLRVLASNGRLETEQPLARFAPFELAEAGVPGELIPKVQAIRTLADLRDLEGDLPPQAFSRLADRARLYLEMPTELQIIDQKVAAKEIAELETEICQVIDDLFHSDRFSLIEKKEQLETLCSDNPPSWMFFPLPDQKKWVTRNFKGPVLVRGVPGSGKSITALLRAKYLAEEIAQGPDEKILLITPIKGNAEFFKNTLAQVKGLPQSQVEIHYLFDWAREYLEQAGEYLKSDHANFLEILKDAIDACRQGMPNITPSHLDFNFVRDEIGQIIKGRGLYSQPDYLALPRRGFGSPLTNEEKRQLWRVYLKYKSILESQQIMDREDLLVKSLALLPKKPPKKKYVSVIIDDTQDVPPIALKIFHQLVQNHPNGLFMLSDITQKFTRGGDVVGNLGIELCIRPPLLRANMRNTAEIADASMQVLEKTRFDEIDGSGAQLAIAPEVAKHGAAPQFQTHENEENEILWIQELLVELTGPSFGYKPSDILLIARTNRYLTLLEVNLSQAQIAFQDLRRQPGERDANKVHISSYLDCRGLEYPVVILTEVVDGVLPTVPTGIDSDELNFHLSLERRLLSCAMNRAREMLFVSGGGGTVSRFVTALVAGGEEKDLPIADAAEKSSPADQIANN